MMKTNRFNLMSCCTVACLMAGAAMAQVATPDSTRPNAAGTAVQPGETSTASHQVFRSKDLVGANVKDAQNKKLGDISEIYLNPQTGMILAAIDIDGNRDAVVPLQAMSVTATKGALGGRNVTVTLNTTEAQLKSGPTINGNEWEKLGDASFAQTVYSHYQLQAPTGMGSASTPGGTFHGGAQQNPTDNK